MSNDRKRIRGIRNEEEYPRNTIKRARLRGEGYRNYKNRVVPEKTIGPPCKCALKCFEKLSEKDRKDIFQQFYDLDSKDDQDLYLQTLIDANVPKQRRKRNPDGKDRGFSYKHHLMVKGERIKVCAGAFSSIHGITNERLRRLKRLKVNDEIPKDRRGNKSPLKFRDDIRQRMKEHILSFCCFFEDVCYLDTNCTIKELHQKFLKKPGNQNVSYNYFIRFFREKMTPKIQSRKPVFYDCVRCCELNLDIRRTQNRKQRFDLAKERELHLEECRSFNLKLEEALKFQNNAIIFKFIKQLHLPKVPIDYGTIFSLHLFWIYDLKTKKSYFYIYHEADGCEDSNEVSTFIKDYLDNYLDPESQNLTIFNTTQLEYSTKTHVNIQKIECMKGHPYYPPDMVKIEDQILKQLKNHDRIYSVHEYSDYIIQGIPRPERRNFTIKEITHEDFLNFDNMTKLYGGQLRIDPKKIEYLRKIVEDVPEEFGEAFNRIVELSCL